MKIKAIMKRTLKTVTPTDTLLHARDLMVWSEIRHLPVLESGSLVGILSERDVAAYQAQIGESIASNPRDTVDRAMRRDPQTADPEDTVADVSAKMADMRIGCMPVLSKGELIGIVTTTDILAVQASSTSEPSAPEGPVVSEAMTADVEVARPDDGLMDSAARMQRLRIRHLPVVDVDNRVLGMLSDRDIRSAVGDPRGLGRKGGPGPRIATLKVRNVMTQPVITVNQNEPCIKVARSFAEVSASAVAVVDHSDRLVGMLSYIDVLRALADHYD